MSRIRNMRRLDGTALTLALAGACAAGLSSSAFAATPERTDARMTLRAPEELAKRGVMYYVRPRGDVQITFTSDAPFERVVGTSGGVVGFVVANPDASEGESPLLVGAFRLPVRSLDTAIALRNHHLQSERWLNAKSYPDVAFDLQGVEGAKVVKRDEENGFTTYEGTLVGAMTVMGATRDMRIPARFTFMKQSQKTRIRMPGDLLAIRCQYTLHMKDFGVGQDASNSVLWGARVSDEIEIEQFLVLSTRSLEAQAEGLAPLVGGMPAANLLLACNAMLTIEKDIDAARALAERVLREQGDNAQLLNSIASQLLSDEAPEKSLGLAERLAIKAVEASGGTDGSILDTLAGVQYAKGDVRKALETQRKAMEHAPDDQRLRQGMEAALHKYESEVGG